MFIRFFLALKAAGLPVGTRELLHLQEALQEAVVQNSAEDFYFLCRSIFVKREQHLDKFDRTFASTFGQLSDKAFDPLADIPEEWLRKNGELVKQPEQDEAFYLKELLQKLQERFQELLNQQKERHEGGNTWIGTGGSSSFGAFGYNQQGYRIGQDEGRNRKAVKVWDERVFKELDDSRSLDTRQFQMALRRLRLLSREGAPDVFDIDETIHQTCQNAGIIKEVYRPERSNGIRLLLLFDVGGSMDEHVLHCKQLFSAARHEFKQLEYFYFHNCLYEKIWKDSRRRRYDFTSTHSLFHTYPPHYKVVVVGDASMSPYELEFAGGSVEHANAEPGKLWLHRLRQHFPHTIWLNPVPEKEWTFTETIGQISQLFGGNMFPLTLNGLEKGIKVLKMH